MPVSVSTLHPEVQASQPVQQFLDLQNELAGLVLKLKPCEASKPSFKRILWCLKNSEVINMLDHVEKVKGTVTLALSVQQMCVVNSWFCQRKLIGYCRNLTYQAQEQVRLCHLAVDKGLSSSGICTFVVDRCRHGGLQEVPVGFSSANSDWNFEPTHEIEFT